MSMWSRLRNTIHGDRHRAEIEEELQFHLEMDGAGGHDRRQSRLRLGNPTRIAEETRAAGIVEWLDSAWQDARFGLRQLHRTPALTLAVVLSLAVGLGANTAMFTLVDAAILRPLPVDRPGALVLLEWTNEGFPPDVENHNGEFRPIAGGRHQGSSVPASLYRRLAAQQRVFSSLMAAGAYPEPVAIAADWFPAEQVSVQYVSSNFFQGLGTPPAAGRPFLPDDDRVGAEPVIIVSHRFSAKRFAGGANAIGASVRINNVAARIVGVSPAGFFGLRTGQWADVYAPLAAKVAFQTPPGAPRSENDRNWWVRQVGRLKPGVDEAAAGEEIRSLFRNLAVPEGTTVEPAKIPSLITLPGGRGVNALNSGDVNALWILLLLVGVLLLIVCANVANLLLSRAVGRRRESTVRLALGAPRARLFRQHLIESGMLALVGGAAGLAVGYAMAQSIQIVFQTGRDASNAFDLHLDPRVLAYTSLLSLLTALLFGLAPAAHAARGDLNGILKGQAKSVMAGRLRLPRLLVTVQIALCLTALVAAGLLARSLDKLKWTDIGFDRENLVYASVSPSRAGYTAERTAPYMERLRDELSRLPGVVSVSPVSTRLLSGGGNNGRVNLPGRPWNDDHRADLNGVGDSFFATLGIPLLSGRVIERRDIDSAAEVAVVDELFAARFFPNQIAVGRRFGLDQTRNDQYEIVGIVGTSRYNTLRRERVPALYHPYRPGGTIHFAIRTTIDAASLDEPVRRAVAAVDPAVPLNEFHTQTALIDRVLRTERMLSYVSGAFGLVALALAAIGLGGLLAYATARRTSEIGVRMALGAARGDVVRMVVRDSLALVATGIVVGLPCAYAVGRALTSSLFQVEPFDGPTSAAAVAVLLIVALIAAWVPARRAARIDPLLALREE